MVPLPLSLAFTSLRFLELSQYRSVGQTSLVRSLSRGIWLNVGAPTSERSRLYSEGNVKELTAKEMGERDKDLEDKKKCLRLLVAFVVRNSSFPLDDHKLLMGTRIDAGRSETSSTWRVRNRMGWSAVFRYLLTLISTDNSCFSTIRSRSDPCKAHPLRSKL